MKSHCAPEQKSSELLFHNVQMWPTETDPTDRCVRHVLVGLTAEFGYKNGIKCSYPVHCTCTCLLDYLIQNG